MTRKIAYQKWQEKISDITPSDHRIGTDLLLIDRTKENMYMPTGAFRSDATTVLLYESGNSRIRVNMTDYEVSAPCVLLIMKDAIYESLWNSADVRFRAIIMSRDFLGSLSPELGQEQIGFNLLNSCPIIHSDDISLVFNRYYDLLLDIVKAPDSRFKLKAAKHLTLSMFYGYTAEKVCGMKEIVPKSRQEELFTRFIENVRTFYKSQRSVSFYAERLCVSTKYLSRTVSEYSGHPASYFIDGYVTTEIKAMLSSTAMTIQEIAYELNFPSQSVFGKYFRRMTGVSPRKYRIDSFNSV